MEDVKELDERDWFAGQALSGILACANYPPQGSGEPMDQFVARVTESAYRIATAMVKHGRRLKKESPTKWAASIG